MKISEFVNECQEFIANRQWIRSSFFGRSVPENTRVEPGFHQNMVWLQGAQTTFETNEDVVNEVLGWTNWNPHIISKKELVDAYMGRYEDREVNMKWL